MLCKKSFKLSSLFYARFFAFLYYIFYIITIVNHIALFYFTILDTELFISIKILLLSSGILGDKTIEDKLIYLSNDDTQNQPFCRLQLRDSSFGYCFFFNQSILIIKKPLDRYDSPYQGSFSYFQGRLITILGEGSTTLPREIAPRKKINRSKTISKFQPRFLFTFSFGL